MNTEETMTNEETTAAADVRPARAKGFAGMTREQVRAIASKGGTAAHAVGTAHKFSSEEARAAGTKGGNAPHVRRGKGPRTEAKP